MNFKFYLQIYGAKSKTTNKLYPARYFQINIDPESLKPKLPSRRDLRPYPTTSYLEYRGHTGPVMTISADITGQWLASGSISFSFSLIGNEILIRIGF